jgi:hypothetical protein
LDENQTEVPFSSFHIPQVPNLIKSETDGVKNKGRKAPGANMYLTLFFIVYQLMDCLGLYF